MNLLNLLDQIPLYLLLVGAILLGLAPFFPEPHLLEKTRMLLNGTLTKPLDIFDFFLHLSLPALLILKLWRTYVAL